MEEALPQPHPARLLWSPTGGVGPSGKAPLLMLLEVSCFHFSSQRPALRVQETFEKVQLLLLSLQLSGLGEGGSQNLFKFSKCFLRKNFKHIQSREKSKMNLLILTHLQQ